MLLFHNDKNTKCFLEGEIDYVLSKRKCSLFDRDGIIELLLRVHNDQYPNSEVIDMFFQGASTVDRDTVLKLLLSTVPIPDITLKESDIFPKEQMKILPMVIPDIKNARYGDNSVMKEISEYVKRANKGLFGINYKQQYGVIDRNGFGLYESESRDRESIFIPIEEIQSVSCQEIDRSVYPLCIAYGDKEIVLGFDDEASQKNWQSAIATFCILYMASSNFINEANFKWFVEFGANVDVCYSFSEPQTVLNYLYMKNRRDMCNWLIQKGAKVNCLLRWEFMVVNHVLTPMEVFEIMEKHGINMRIKSDDGFGYNIMHYMCYYGDIDGIKKCLNCKEHQNLVNDPNENSDIGLTITLLSPLLNGNQRNEIALLLYAYSNMGCVNASSQNPAQITLLRGCIGLLFHMLPYYTGIWYDQYYNTLLLLAIKAGLPTVARYIIRVFTIPGLEKLDCNKDSALTLAVKANREELACEVLKNNADPMIRSKNWCMENCTNDSILHQALKRGMVTLACMLCELWSNNVTLLMEKDCNGDTPLHIAIAMNMEDCVCMLLSNSEARQYVSIQNARHQDTPLHTALKLGHYAYCHRLLEVGADVNCCNEFNYTPLHLLVMLADGQYCEGDVMTFEEMGSLLESMICLRPDIHIQCTHHDEYISENCLHSCIRGGEKLNAFAVSLIGYDNSIVHDKNEENSTPLILAVMYQNIDMVKVLYEMQAEINIITKSGESPLHIAVKLNNVGIVEYLVSQYGYVRMWNKEGNCPIHEAIRMHSLKLVELLCGNGIDANLRTKTGLTPFMLACISGAADIAYYLLDHEADPFLLDNDGNCCLNLVVKEMKRADNTIDFAETAYILKNIAYQYKVDYFGSLDETTQYISELEECAKNYEEGVSTEYLATLNTEREYPTLHLNDLTENTAIKRVSLRSIANKLLPRKTIMSLETMKEKQNKATRSPNETYHSAHSPNSPNPTLYSTHSSTHSSPQHSHPSSPRLPPRSQSPSTLPPPPPPPPSSPTKSSPILKAGSMKKTASSSLTKTSSLNSSKLTPPPLPVSEHKSRSLRMNDKKEALEKEIKDLKEAIEMKEREKTNEVESIDMRRNEICQEKIAESQEKLRGVISALIERGLSEETATEQGIRLLEERIMKGSKARVCEQYDVKINEIKEMLQEKEKELQLCN